MKFTILLISIYLVMGCAQPDLHKTYTIPEITIHIVGSRDQFPLKNANDNAMGWIVGGKEIWVLGRMLEDGTIYARETTIGHEIMHILNFLDPEVIRFPDKPRPLTLWDF